MSRRPNVPLVMVDELAPKVLPVHGQPVVRAPHLDRLARPSVVFDSAYTASPLCAPARASLLSGRWSRGIEARETGAELSPEIPTIAHYLRATPLRARAKCTLSARTSSTASRRCPPPTSAPRTSAGPRTGAGHPPTPTRLASACAQITSASPDSGRTIRSGVTRRSAYRYLCSPHPRRERASS